MFNMAEGLQRLGAQFVPFLFAIVAHEFGHGWMALRFGDKTAKESGRLTLNPIPHIDPIGTLLFPIINMVSGMMIMFGWAKPVPIDPSRFSSYRKGLFWVSLAGPLMNFALGFFSAVLLFAMTKYSPDFIFYKEFQTMLQISIYLNYGLAVFNLLPLPPLDGSKVVESFLSPRATLKYEEMTKYSFFILLMLMFTGAFKYLGIPIIFLAGLTLNILAILFNIPYTDGGAS